mmetsp:Transcript_113631/g.332043  ORF Transcript_113631/g.332043 Transcript_113631/m.332043 type:complete len:245 (+) Transcript_113631:653-1387(+)
MAASQSTPPVPMRSSSLRRCWRMITSRPARRTVRVARSTGRCLASPCENGATEHSRRPGGAGSASKMWPRHSAWANASPSARDSTSAAVRTTVPSPDTFTTSSICTKDRYDGTGSGESSTAPKSMLPSQIGRSPTSSSSEATGWSSSTVVNMPLKSAGSGSPRANSLKQDPSTVRRLRERGNSGCLFNGCSSSAPVGGGSARSTPVSAAGALSFCEPSLSKPGSVSIESPVAQTMHNSNVLSMA